MTYIRRTLLIAAVTLIFSGGQPVAADWLKTLKGAVDQVTQPQSSGGTPVLGGLTTEDMISGLKEALRVGTETVTSQLGAADGFNTDANVHIPLPEQLQNVQSTLRKFGMSAMADEVELKLNRGAEAAMPKAKELVWKAITSMTLEDAKGIFDGPKDAATQYFRRVATSDLKATVAPVIDKSLQDVGALAAYDALIGQYKTIPFVPDLKADLQAHATNLALEGLFHYLAQEEAAIRDNPAKRTTDILTRVFGGG
ncbi:MAG: DUF4197 domain-containing protein [Rhodospirillaceae bacterium]|jgi:hypothetical protein|nr:DUF4197 domain-containing protein [Rhodospirillaceae bacterium]